MADTGDVNNLSSRPFSSTGPMNMPCKLVSKEDPEKRGRVQLRFVNQLESQIPDESLPWTVPEGQTTSGIGTFHLGNYVIGQWFNGSIKDDGQTTTFGKTISSAGKDGAPESSG